MVSNLWSQAIVTMSHVSIEPDRMAAAMADPRAQQIADKLKEKHKGKKVSFDAIFLNTRSFLGSFT